MPRKEASANPGCPMVYHITNKTKALLRLCFCLFHIEDENKNVFERRENKW